jgi:hypothetical protein
VDGAVDFMHILSPSPALALGLPPQRADGDGGRASLDDLDRGLGLLGANLPIGDEIDDQLSILQMELMLPPEFTAEVEDVIRERVPDNRRETNNIIYRPCLKHVW